MRPNHLVTDITPSDAPEGAALYILNGLLDPYSQLLTNEPGHSSFATLLESNSISSNRIIITGILPLDNDEVLFFGAINHPGSGWEDYGHIQLMHRDGSMELIMEGRFKFLISRPIDATFKRNFKGERVIAFTDSFNEPKLINIDNPAVDTSNFLNDEDVSRTKLFRDHLVPQINLLNTAPGGGLESGVYYLFAFYEHSDGTRSNYFEVNNPISIVETSKTETYAQYSGAPAGTSTNKLINIEVNKIDTRHSYLGLGAVKEVNGVREAYVFKTVRISGESLRTTHTGEESLEGVSIDEVLIPRRRYSRVETLASLDKTLYLGGLQERSLDVGFQKYANNIKIDYDFDEHPEAGIFKRDEFDPANPSEPLTWDSFKEDQSIYFGKIFMPFEVYAVYMHFLFTDGTTSVDYHIPGRAPAAIGKAWNDYGLTGNENDLITDVISNNALGSSHYLHNDKLVSSEARFFHTRETANNPNADSSIGFWENQDETYPDTDDWDIWDQNGDTGNTLRNKKVRHPKIPGYCCESADTSALYDKDHSTANPRLFRTPVLKLSNIFIPDHIWDQVHDVRITFAKRNSQNSTVLGQSLLLPAEDYSTTDWNYPSEEPDVRSGCLPTRLTWSSTDYQAAWCAYENPLNNNTSPVDWYYKSHSFDMIHDRISGGVDFVTLQAAFQHSLHWDTESKPTGYIDHLVIQSDGSTDSGNLYHFDFLRHDKGDPDTYTSVYQNSQNPNGAEWIPALEEHNKVYASPTVDEGYADINQGYSDYWNINRETGYIFKLRLDAALTTEALYKFNDDNNWSVSAVDSNSDNRNQTSPVFKIFNLHQFKTNCYLPFDEQELFIGKNSHQLITNEQSVSGGVLLTMDTLTGGDCFLSDYSFRATSNVQSDYTSTINQDVVTSILYSIPCITRHNVNLRHEGENPASDLNQTFYPKLANDTWSRQDLLERPLFEDNSYLYNDDYSRLSDFNPLIPFSKSEDHSSSDLSTVIAASEQDTLQKQYEPWRVFLSEDFYKIVDLKYGGIKNLTTAGDRLVINMENATFMTYGQTEMSTDQISAYIGKGDIFRGRPQEVVPVELGYAGTKHKKSVTTTPFGIFIYDSERRSLFKIGDGAEEISAKDLQEFFRDHMHLKSKDQVESLTGTYDINFESAQAPTGAGFITTYEYENQRLLLTKRDYTIPDSHAGQLQKSLTYAEYLEEDPANYSKGDFIVVEGVPLSAATFNTGGTTPQFFMPADKDGIMKDGPNGSVVAFVNDESKTLSYDLVRHKFISYHSYYPNVYISTRNRDFSMRNNAATDDSSMTQESVYLWGDGNPGEYHGNSSDPFEVVIPLSIRDSYESYLFAIYLDTYVRNSNGVLLRDETFDRLRVMDSYQVSQELTLSYPDNMRQINQEFFINKFLDEKDESNPVEFDRTFEPVSSIDTTKHWSEKGPFIDQYFIIKFRYLNSEGKRIYFHNVRFNTHETHR